LINLPISLIAVNEIFPKTKIWVWIIIIIITLFVFFFSHIIFLRIHKKDIILTILFLINIALISYYYNARKDIFKKTEKEIISAGYFLEPKKIFPKEYSKEKCDDWFKTLKLLTIQKWTKFYEKNIQFFLNEKYFKELLENSKIKEDIKKIEKDPLWKEFFEINKVITEKMDFCPHLQWVEPEEYINDIYYSPVPNLFSLTRWIKILFAYAQIEKIKGNFEEEEKAIAIIEETIKKIKIEGQIDFVLMVNQYIEELYILNSATSLSILKKPLPFNKEEKLKEIADGNLNYIFNGFYINFLKTYVWVKDLKFLKSKDKIHKFFISLFSYGFTKYYLESWIKILKLKNEINVNKNKFLWKKYKSFLPKKSFFFPNFEDSYLKFMILLTQKRALLISNEIIKYFEKEKKLPEKIDFIKTELRIDPFSEKDFIYLKESNKKFMVYSVGPDGINDGGKNLYIIGNYYEKLKQDIGFCFSF